MYKHLFRTMLGIVGILVILSMGVVKASDYVSTVPGLVVTGEQDGQIFEYGVLKFDDGSGHMIMLLDRNLGATEVWNGFTGDMVNTGSYGYHYQWGNNYGFPIFGDIMSGNYSTYKVIYYTGYANNGYYGNVFIKGNYTSYDYWTGNRHYDNLRGGGGDTSGNNYGLDLMTKYNIKNRQGPCPDGYHVPSAGEWNNLLKYRVALYTGAGNNINSWEWGISNNGLLYFEDKYVASGIRDTFRIPPDGTREYGEARVSSGFSVLWSSSPEVYSYRPSMNFYVASSFVRSSYSSYRANGLSVRCFSDDYLFPYHFSFMDGNMELLSGSVIFGEKLINLVNLAELNTTKEGYYFNHRYMQGTEDNPFDITGTTITGNITLYAKRAAKEYTISYELHDGVISGESATGYTIESGDITLINPSKNGYTFTGWSGTDIDGFSGTVVIPSGSTGDRSYEANWEINQYTITFKDGENEITSITADYGTGITPPSNPTKNGYKFIGWEPETPATMPAENRTIYAKWERNGSSGGGGGGGGGGGSSSSSSTGSNTPNQQSGTGTNNSTGTQNDQTTTGTIVNEPEGTGNNAEIQTGSQIDSNTGSIVSSGTNINNPDTETPNDSATSSQSDDKTYSTEFQQAYEFAKGNGITTMPTIQKANMEGKLTRIAMAKMLSQYAINILGQKPDTIQNIKFNDVTDKMDTDYDDGVTLAYQLGIMGQNMPGNNFRPDDEVTRAEFATALSRMAYGTSDGEYKGTGKYYIHHMEKLVKEGIITKDDPNMKELRGYVMIMLMRSAK